MIYRVIGTEDNKPVCYFRTTSLDAARNFQTDLYRECNIWDTQIRVYVRDDANLEEDRYKEVK